jgi:hypothetical protein
VLKLIKKENHQVMPWKNSQGITSQIAIYPETAVFPSDSFHWRLSSATVKNSGPFSLFPGCDRWLAVLSGDGMTMNGSKLGPLTPLHFSGEIPIHSELINGEVIDLGLIYRRDKFSAKMTLEQISSTKTSFFDRGTHLFYCIAGDLKINETHASVGDAIIIEGPFEATLSTKQTAKYFYIELMA